jgi:hypothetical protein
MRLCTLLMTGEVDTLPALVALAGSTPFFLCPHCPRRRASCSQQKHITHIEALHES